MKEWKVKILAHHFTDKLFVFIGNPTRCSRQTARESLTAVGGVLDERIIMFTHYVVAFSGAEKTKTYRKAAEYAGYGQLALLNEEQFFDVLEGKAQPPEKKNPPQNDNIIITEARNPEAREAEMQRAVDYMVMKKRAKNFMRYGNPVPDNESA